MATTTTHDAANFPHLLKMVGDVVSTNGNLDRAAVSAALFSNTNPIGDLTGKVDFIICFNRTGGGPDWASENHSAAFAPRPLRGIVQVHNINLANDSQLDRMGPLFSLLLQEMGHYWIRDNAGQAKIRTSTVDVDTPMSADMIAALNAGGAYPAFPMIGRQDSHWSPFLDGVNSPFEAGKFGTQQQTRGFGPFGWFGRYTQVEGQPKVGPTFVLPGSDGGTVTSVAAYSFFERWLMGDWSPPQLTTGTVWPTFSVIEPIWAFPLFFQAGLFIEVMAGQRVYLGYDQGPHRIQVRQTDNTYTSLPVVLPTDPYRPHEAVGLRVVQIGSTIRLQTRVWPVRTYLGPRFRLYLEKPDPSCDEIFSDFTSGLTDPGMGAADPYVGWRTIGTRSGSVRDIGLSSRSLQTGGGGTNRTYGVAYTRLRARLCLFDGNVTQPIDVNSLSQTLPKAGPVRLADGRLIMPYNNGSYGEDDLVHEAPRWTMPAPNRDFGLGGIVRLESCAMVSWAGGLAPGVKLVGPLKRVKFNDFLLPADPFRPRRVEPPHNGAYKVLFCAVSRTDPEINNATLTALDRIRRAFEIYYSEVTSRALDTTIV
ncbi:MAG TPA: hypothetical protein VGQ48_00310 [Gemmatimonadales bacterium]|jgi:hypothetical protein|nr:hypothetical protein [Gemmatimonadales bacterium]